MKPNLGGINRHCKTGWSALTRNQDETWCWKRVITDVRTWYNARNHCSQVENGMNNEEVQLALPLNAHENGLLLEFRVGVEEFIWIGCHFDNVKGLARIFVSTVKNTCDSVSRQSRDSDLIQY